MLVPISGAFLNWEYKLIIDRGFEVRVESFGVRLDHFGVRVKPSEVRLERLEVRVAHNQHKLKKYFPIFFLSWAFSLFSCGRNHFSCG